MRKNCKRYYAKAIKIIKETENGRNGNSRRDYGGSDK